MKPALVLGGGIAGMQAALDLANQGFKVYLVERAPSIGGVMAKLDRTFPTLDCAACLITPRLVDTGRHPNIDLLAYSEAENIQGEVGNFRVTVVKKPRYVDEEKCTGCGVCAQHCPIIVPSEHDMGLGPRKAIYVPFPQAVPLKYTIDMENCVRCGLCKSVCQPQAVDFGQEPVKFVLNVGAIVIATGFKLDNPARREEYGYDRYENVITTLHLERLLSPSGPTGGHILRPSDGRIPRRIAFIQCVCSRDERTNLYCSRFCCMYAIKNSMLLKDHVHGCDVAIFYMDVRTFGKGYEELYTQAEEEYGVRFVKARPAEVVEDPATKNLLVRYEDIIRGKIAEEEFDLVVLSVGVIPPEPSAEINRMLSLPTADDNFLTCRDPYFDAVATPVEGIFAVGGAESPKDISDTVTQASAAAIRASIILKD